MAARAQKGGVRGPAGREHSQRGVPAGGELGVSVVLRGPLLMTVATRLRSVPGS